LPNVDRASERAGGLEAFSRFLLPHLRREQLNHGIALLL
jgi:hypothetical protein